LFLQNLLAKNVSEFYKVLRNVGGKADENFNISAFLVLKALNIKAVLAKFSKINAFLFACYKKKSYFCRRFNKNTKLLW